MPFCYCNFLEQQHDEIPKKVYCGRLSANIVEVESTTDHRQNHTFPYIRVSCKPILRLSAYCDTRMFPINLLKLVQ